MATFNCEYSSLISQNHSNTPHILASLPARARMEHGNLAAVKWIGKIGEYRIDWGPGLRIYLARDGKER